MQLPARELTFTTSLASFYLVLPMAHSLGLGPSPFPKLELFSA